MTDSTFDSVIPGPLESRSLPLTLTILVHPDVRRLGEQAVLEGEGTYSLSRVEPSFCLPGGPRSPLLTRHVSRQPVRLVTGGGAVRIASERKSTCVNSAKQVSPGVFLVGAEQLLMGVVLSLGRGVAVLVRRAAPASHDDSLGLVGPSPELQRLREQIVRVALGSGPVLIHGETGTGKELTARAIHKLGPRAKRSWVATNLAALPAGTAASQLFGHTRGAFTGADSRALGYFGQADGGTLFLDELGEAPLDIQPMLLRALESGEVQVVGGGVRTVDVRVITATDANLGAALASGRLRRALYHRLAGTMISLSPLRARREDIAAQLRYFTIKQLRALGREQRLDEAWLKVGTQRQFITHRWPGNSRQLARAVEAMVVECVDAPVATAPRSLGTLQSSDESESADDARDGDLRARVRDFEVQEIRNALARVDWNRAAAAALLGIPVRTLAYKIKTLKIA